MPLVTVTDEDTPYAPGAAERDLQSLATRVGVLTGILVALGLATLASFSLDAGPGFTLLILSVIAVVNLGPRLLVSAIKLAQIDSEWRALGVAGMVVGVVATMALALAVVAFILIGAGCHGGSCRFV
jgi:hypothetical protein